VVAPATMTLYPDNWPIFFVGAHTRGQPTTPRPIFGCWKIDLNWKSVK